ncbi:unnamed protein product, partial [Mesorhabditis spiculigera]
MRSRRASSQDLKAIGSDFEIQAMIEEPDVVDDAPWDAIRLSAALLCILGINSSIFTPGLWGYLQSLDKYADVAWLGRAMSTQAVTSILADPFFGWCQQHYGFRVPLKVTVALVALGNVLYALLYVAGEWRYVVLVASRALLGFLAPSITLFRVFATTSVGADERQRACLYQLAGFITGLALGPFIQAAFGYVPALIVSGVVLDKYSWPPAVMALSSCFILVVVHRHFPGRHVKRGPKPEKAERDEMDSQNTAPRLRRSDLIILSLLLYLYAAVSIASAAEYMIAAPLTRAMYGWTDAEFLVYHWPIQTGQCLAGTAASLIVAATPLRKIDHRRQLAFALSMLIIGSLSLYPWPFYPSVSPQITQQITTSVTKKIPLPLYVMAMVICYGPSLAIANSLLTSITTEVLGNRQQGLVHSVMSAAGGVGTALWPLFAIRFFPVDGTRTISLCNASIYGIGLLMFLAAARYLGPRAVEEDAEADDTEMAERRAQ